MGKRQITVDDRSNVSARRVALVLYGISTLVVVLAGLALILLGVIIIINFDAISEIIAAMPEMATVFAMLDPFLIIVIGVLVLLFGNIINFVVYKVILTLAGLAADVKVIRDRYE